MTTIGDVKRPSAAGHLRLVWALAAKDVADAVRSKTTLTTLVIALLMVIFYRYYPALMAGDALNVLLYAETDTVLEEVLARSPALALYTYDSRARLLDVFAGADEVELALVATETAVAQQQAGGGLTLDGYVMYWVDAAKRAEIAALVEAELGAQLGQPVTLRLHDVYFDADTFFFAFSATIALLFMAIIIGISVVPNLMVEEKQARTLDVLRVSPAAAAHIVAGKALAGLFYGLLCSAIVLIVFRYLILQWGLAVLAAVLATLFMVALGLLLGMWATARAQLQLVAWFVILPLLMPVILVALEGLVPTGVIAVLNWIPTVLVAKIFRLALTPNATFAHYGAALAVTALTTLALLGLVVWAVRRQE
ncbi:MAG: ABC transporter permease [Anaerolineales bacterium]|nr:ABC transporter permease [Anaerolineales bacterium]